MTDHPGPRGRKALGAAPRFGRQPRWLLARAAAAARRVGGLVFSKRFRGMTAPLIGRMRFALLCRHTEKVRRGEDHARRLTIAARTSLRIVAFRHRPEIGERAAIVTKIIIDRHVAVLK